ncbi:hypothetical protein J1605_011462 [Eschrichtius robustus]|uniref:Serpin B10 n=1 Tax=Eschrichtius robustus TaxID=9764 RepID=A0AB34GKM7_ESCRO|nr:hypothetical protein J1605_011462 [Eschrichtius robustus]
MKLQVLQFSRDQDSKSCPDSFEKKKKMEFNVGKVEEIHSNFQTLISEINNPSNAYILKTANRIYAEKTYQFHNTPTVQTMTSSSVQMQGLLRGVNSKPSQAFTSFMFAHHILWHTSEESQRTQVPSGLVYRFWKNSTKGDFTYIFQKYVQDMKTYFGAEPQSVNFMGASDKIRKEINSWVESQTEGKSSPSDFATYILQTTSKPVQMMSTKEKLQVFYIKKPQAKGLQLFYESHDLSLLILLPEDSSGLDQLEKAITYEKLSEWTSADMMELCDVQLHLPKFKLEETYDLQSTLSSMGMSDAFNQSKADFSGMSTEGNLFLSNVFHKSFVEINEQGTESASGTASEVSVRISLPSTEFNADHPFLFFIRHNKTNSILFYGRFCSP